MLRYRSGCSSAMAMSERHQPHHATQDTDPPLPQKTKDCSFKNSLQTRIITMEGLEAMRVNLPTYKAQLAQVEAQIAAGIVSDELVGVKKQLKELVDLLESTAPAAAATATGTDGGSAAAAAAADASQQEAQPASKEEVKAEEKAAPNASLFHPGSRVEVSMDDGAPSRAATIESRTDLGVYTVKFIGKKAGLPASADVGACESLGWFGAVPLFATTAYSTPSPRSVRQPLCARSSLTAPLQSLRPRPTPTLLRGGR